MIMCSFVGLRAKGESKEKRSEGFLCFSLSFGLKGLGMNLVKNLIGLRFFWSVSVGMRVATQGRCRCLKFSQNVSEL